MIPYVLHVALLLAVCLLFYKLLLQKETYYRLNRLVLLACLALSFLLPLIRVPQQWALQENSQLQKVVIQPAVKQLPQAATPKVKPINTQAVQTPQPVYEPQPPMIERIIKWALYLYWFGVAAFGANLSLQVCVLLFQAYRKPVIVDGAYRIIELDDDKAPCSFGNNIFINPAKYEPDTFNQILLHEKVHVKQGHSLDLLIAELMLAFQWFNPFAWLYREEVESNLEYLADNEVLHDSAVDRQDYQMNLLKVSVPNLSLRITTNYNQSLLKKRIVMMNAKRSNIHTTWKYLFLLPMMAFLICALNQPAASGHPGGVTRIDYSKPDVRNDGNWKATIKGSKLELKLYNNDDRNNMSSSNFVVNEFTALPIGRDGEFKLVREAGTITFNGKFVGATGSGKYKFIADEAFANHLKSEGISGINENDQLAFFMINVKKNYVSMLKNNGYKHISKDNLISAAALNVDEPYVRFWKQSGFKAPSIEDMVSGKALGITPDYVADIKKAGYLNLSFEQLVSFKAQGISGSYLARMNKSQRTPSEKTAKTPVGTIPAEDIISYKALDVDDAYISSLAKEGYSNITNGKLTGLKAVGVDAAYIHGLKSAGFKNASVEDLISARSLGITPEYAASFASTGYKNLSLQKLTTFKALDVTAEFINGFKSAGYSISAEDATSLKSMGITPEFIKSFRSVGFGKLTIGEATTLKAMDITPQYIAQMKEKGFKSDNINKYITLKSAF